jgi:hypothetical protein
VGEGEGNENGYKEEVIKNGKREVEEKADSDNK